MAPEVAGGLWESKHLHPYGGPRKILPFLARHHPALEAPAATSEISYTPRRCAQRGRDGCGARARPYRRRGQTSTRALVWAVRFASPQSRRRPSPTSTASSVRMAGLGSCVPITGRLAPPRPSAASHSYASGGSSASADPGAWSLGDLRRPAVMRACPRRSRRKPPTRQPGTRPRRRRSFAHRHDGWPPSRGARIPGASVRAACQSRRPVPVYTVTPAPDLKSYRCSLLLQKSVLTKQY
jgi:hypothetical protein